MDKPEERKAEKKFTFRAVCEKHALDKNLVLATPESISWATRRGKRLVAEQMQKNWQCDDYTLSWTAEDSK